MRKEINIPFMGFYNSLLDSEIDHEIETAAEYQEESERGIPAGEYSELIYKFADFGQCHNAIAKDYVDAFNGFIFDEYGVDLNLEFSELVCPREYNFTTDRIFCTIPEEKVDELVRVVDRRKLGETIVDRLKSRSGFISYYSDFVREWDSKPVNEWDSNELSMLLHTLVDDVDDFDLTIYCRLNESVYSAFENCVDWPALEAAVDDYLAENEEEEEVDARVFPSGNLSAAKYVDEFCRLNNLKHGVDTDVNEVY